MCKWKVFSHQTQINQVKADLLAGLPVDPVRYFPKGITRLSSIIKRLRDNGLPIITDRDKGNGMARYHLPEGWQPDTKKP
ncbi:hypothetical protein A1507_22860 [Methylomonas koyamae]|uniref:Uncharacterized protein n=1 Tax=Methylomonas koyamae TaxID=702114 RepID=A0A177NRC1_9GAMM|nr:hypothetical protein A1507_22860 [Methylomonas koyamae]